MKDKKAAALEKLNRHCRQLVAQVYPQENKIPVLGEGDPNAVLVMVGEAPGEQETLLQRPFVGKAGKNLDAFLSVVQLERREIYITNTVKIRPVRISEKGRASNRPPNKEELGLFEHILFSELDIIQPQVVVTLGNTPLRAIMAEPRLTIGEVHGQTLTAHTEKGNFILFPLYHPASIIYNRALKETYDRDLECLRDYIALHGIKSSK